MYSYFCKHCGFSFASKNKEEVRTVKAEHRPWVKTRTIPSVNLHRCIDMVKTRGGTLARKGLAEFLDSTKYAEVA